MFWELSSESFQVGGSHSRGLLMALAGGGENLSQGPWWGWRGAGGDLRETLGAESPASAKYRMWECGKERRERGLPPFFLAGWRGGCDQRNARQDDGFHLEYVASRVGGIRRHLECESCVQQRGSG